MENTAATGASAAHSSEIAAALQRSSGDDWLLKGEGNANIVLAYTGSDPVLVGRVLRLRKVKAKQQQQQQQQWEQQQQDGSVQLRQEEQKHHHHHQQQHRGSAATTSKSAAAAAATFTSDSAAAAIAALEADIWQPVIPDWQQLDAMQRELAFVQTVLAPALHNSCTLAVAAAAAAPVPATLLQQLQGQGCKIQEGVTGLLLPDVTMLHPNNIPAGFTGVGPCICFEIKPKAGFMPGPGSAVAEGSIKRKLPRFVMHQLLKHLQGKSPAMSRYNPLDLFQNNAAAAAAAGSSSSSNIEHRQQQQQQERRAELVSSSSGSSDRAEAAVNNAAAAAVASCGFDVLLSRQQAALAALLECPYNNLKVFIDGAFVYGGKADVAMTTAAPHPAAAAAAAITRMCKSHVRQATEPLASSSGGDGSGSSSSSNETTVPCVGETLPSIRTAAPSGSLRAAAAAAMAGGGSSSSSSRRSLDDVISSPTWAARRWNISALMEQLEQFPQQQQQQQQQHIADSSSSKINSCSHVTVQRVSKHAAQMNTGASAAHTTPAHQEQPTAAAAVYDKELLLCRLLSGVLNESCVLRKLLALQMRDTLDIEGIEPLYNMLITEWQQQHQHKQIESTTTAPGNPQWQCHSKQQQQAPQHQQQQRQQQQQQRNTSPGAELPRQDQNNGSQPQQRRQQFDALLLLPSCRQQQLSIMRDYLTAATAKDCAIMITLQQVIQTQQQQQQQQQQHLCPGSSSSSSSADGTASGVYTDPPSGCSFAWQLSLVDLDLKPLAKITQHAALDRRVIAAAMEHRQLLQQHLGSRERWLKVWLTQQQQQQQQQQDV